MVVISDCSECKHYNVDKKYLKGTCSAYPDGIPSGWLFGGNPKETSECNNGVGFEPEAGEEKTGIHRL